MPIATKDYAHLNPRSRVTKLFFVSISSVLLLVLANFTPSRAAINAWTNIALPGVQVPEVLIDSNNPNILYARTARDGVFKTNDGGVTWLQINTGLNLCFSPGVCQEGYLEGLSSIAIAPTDSNVLYAAIHSNIYRSVNGGATWDKISALNIDPFGAKVLGIDPTNHNSLYAGGTSVYKSVDGGASWTRPFSFPSSEVSALAIHPQAPHIIYAGTILGVVKSQDAGNTWTKINTGITFSFLATEGLPIKLLAIAPTDGNVLYAYAGLSGAYGLFKTTSGGAEWQQINTDELDEVKSLLIDPTDPHKVAVGTDSGIYTNLGTGEGWQAQVLSGHSVLSLATYADVQAPLYAGTDNGIFLAEPALHPPALACHYLNPGDAVPEGFGAPYDVRVNHRELLLKAFCNQDTTEITVGGMFPPLRYVYHQAYFWNGAGWEAVNLECTGERLADVWCVQGAIGTLSATAPLYIAYVCNLIGDQWKCGCRDEACNESFWQIQLLSEEMPANVTVPGPIPN